MYRGMASTKSDGELRRWAKGVHERAAMEAEALVAPPSIDRWYVGAMNDVLYIIDRPPALGNNDAPDRPGGQLTVAGPFYHATLAELNAICDAHNGVRLGAR